MLACTAGARLARHTHLQVAKADLDLTQIVLRHDPCELVYRSDVDETLHRPVGLQARRLLHFFLAREQESTRGQHRAFVYPDDPGKESAPIRRGSCPARPYADIVKRCAAVGSDAVVAYQGR